MTESERNAELPQGERVGFTGTRHGMTEPQRATVAVLLGDLKPEWAHHGDCVGADAEFHALATEAGARVMLHPPSDPKLRAKLVGDDIAPEKPYLVRNRDIVNACTVLIGAPNSMTEGTIGGTWFTINYARKKGCPVIVVWPDGSVLNDGGPKARG